MIWMMMQFVMKMTTALMMRIQIRKIVMVIQKVMCVIVMVPMTVYKIVLVHGVVI